MAGLTLLSLLFLSSCLCSVSCHRVQLGVLYDDESRVQKDGVSRAIELLSDSVQTHPDVLIDTSNSKVAASAALAIGLPLVSANLMHPQPAAIGRHVVIFKSPDWLLVEAAREAITHYQLSERKVRVLYDDDYAALIPLMDKLLRVSDIEFESVQGLEGDTLSKTIRRMRNPKVSGFMVFANTETISKLADAINENDMFRKAFTWIFVTKDKRKVKCTTCKHANLLVIQPVVCHLHEYSGSAVPAISLKDRVDFFFFYDLTRVTMQAFSAEAGSIRKAHTPFCSSLPEGEGRQSDFPLEHALFQAAQEFHGKYGEFVISSKDDADVEQATRCHYQDTVMEINRVEYLRDGRSIHKEGSWFYGEPAGSILSRAYDEEGSSGDGEAGGADASCAESKSAYDGYTFVVYHHPPFVTIHAEQITVNSTLEQRAVAKGSRFEKWKKEASEENVYFSGFLIDLLQEIAAKYKEKLNKDFPKHRVIVSKMFAGTSDQTDAKGGGFGSKELPKAAGKEGEEDTTNKEFRGLVQEVRCGQKTIALMPMTPTPERKIVVAFSEPFFDVVSLSIMMKKPILQYHYWKFITVLEYSVWLCITGAYFFTSILLWFFDRSSPYSYRNDPDRYKYDVEKRYFTLKESLWFCITSLTPQGGGEAPKALSGRLVAATWWLFGFIVIASYTANLAAFLTVSRLDHPINSFNELTRQYKIKYAPFEGSSTKTYFERMARIEERFYQVWKDLSLNDDLEEDERAQLAVWDYPISDRFTKIWAAMTEAQSYIGYNEAVHSVKSSGNTSRDGNALVAETPVIDYAVQIHCDLMKVGGEFNPRPNSLMFNVRDRDFMKEIDLILVEMKKNGQIQQLKDKWWYQTLKKRECYEHRKLYNGITLENAGGIFMVIAVGVGATVIALWIENWYYDMRTAYDMKKAKTQSVNIPSVSAIKKNNKRCTIL